MDDSFDALVPFGWTDRTRALFRAVDDAALAPARVVRVERTRCAVIAHDGRDRRLGTAVPLAVGDWVAVSDTAICHVLPRSSTLRRLDPSGSESQLLAANVDVVLVTVPADRPRASRVERELALAWESGATPVVIVTKSDLGAPTVVEEIARRLEGVDVVAVSTVTGAGCEEVHALLRPARTAVLLGPSGAGKSTLANTLSANPVQATGPVRSGDHRGRHTTSSRQLVVLPRGGVLIDTPGLRSLGLVAGTDVGRVFPEIDALAAGCRYADCQHDAEPGCAVSNAVRAGLLDPARLANYMKLTGETARPRPRREPLGYRAAQRLVRRRADDARKHDDPD